MSGPEALLGLFVAGGSIWDHAEVATSGQPALTFTRRRTATATAIPQSHLSHLIEGVTFLPGDIKREDVTYFSSSSCLLTNS